jgi:osmotically-inducible protein OsmY
MNQTYFFTKLTLTLSLISLMGCAPVIVGGGGLVAATVSTEKGFSGSINDTRLSLNVGDALCTQDEKLAHKINFNVENSEVFLTGAVDTIEESEKAEKIVVGVPGIKRVINNIGVGKEATMKDYFNDSLTTVKLRNLILMDNDINSMNYTVKTIEGIIYIRGIAQDQRELDKVLDHASHIPNIKRVVNYVRLKSDPYFQRD